MFWFRCSYTSTKLGFDDTLPEDPCEHVHYWGEDGLHGDVSSRSHRIHESNGEPQSWAPHPHQDKRHDPIDNSPKEHEGNLHEDDKEVVEDELGVLVDKTQHFVERRKSLRLVMLFEAIFKLQLCREFAG